MTTNEWIYVIWAAWIAANTVAYLIVRKEWEIDPGQYGIWIVAVTHSTIFLLMIALWKERRNE